MEGETDPPKEKEARVQTHASLFAQPMQNARIIVSPQLGRHEA